MKPILLKYFVVQTLFYSICAMIARVITNNIKEDWDLKKAIVLLGLRQVGKTTLIQKFVKDAHVLFVKWRRPTNKIATFKCQL